MREAYSERPPHRLLLGPLRAEGMGRAKIQVTAAIAAAALPEQGVGPHVLAHTAKVS